MSDESYFSPCSATTAGVRHPGSQLGAAKALRLDADARERLERALEVGALLLFRLGERRVMGIGVVADLMAGGEDLLDGLGIAVGRPAGYEERRRQRVLAEQVEDSRHADERAVRLV
jgi:hypothetical protein